MKTILLLFGGESPEHEVSVRSAQNVYTAIDKEKYSVVLVFIDMDGIWWHTPEVLQYTDCDEFEHVEPILGKSAIKVGAQTKNIDIIFPVLHGPNGEDGSVQALAKMLHTPLVGSDMEASLLCMDKVLAKQLLRTGNLPVVRYEVFNRRSAVPSYDELQRRLGQVLFVKPSRMGSSIGVSKVTDEPTLQAALSHAFSLDTKILVEQACIGREFEVSVLGNDDAKASSVGEIIPDHDFYDYEAKYDDTSDTTCMIPAQIPDAITSQVQSYALDAYFALGCSGLARVDFFLESATNQVYINEVNTMPGFTNTSVYPKLWLASGMSYEALVDKLIELAR